MCELFKRKEKSITKEKSKKDKEENEIGSITKIILNFCKPCKKKRKMEKGKEKEKPMTLEVINEDISKDFDSYLWELTGKIITSVNNNNWQKIAQLIEENDAVAYDSDSTFNTSNERKIKSYKEKILDALKDSITAKFNILNKETSPLAIIDKLEFVYEDLESINNQIAPRFLNISRELVLTYHQNVYSLLDDILKSKPDIEIIFRLIRWVRQYHIRVLVDLQHLQISKDWLKPQLLDGREQELADDYINIICSKIQEWKPNLIKNNKEEFIERAQNRDIIDEDQSFRLTQTSVTIDMINQIVEVAIKSEHEKIVVETIKECFQLIIDLQQDMIRTLKSESLKYSKDNPLVNFIEYVFALANDQLRYADFIEEIVEKTQLSNEYINEIKEKTLDGCSRLASVAIDIIMRIMYNQIDGFLKLHTSSWYEESEKFMKDIIDKLTNNTDHYRPHLKEDTFYKFIRTMSQFFVIVYIESMIKKGIKYKMPNFLKLMEQDIQEAQEYFGIYLKETEIEQQFDPISKLRRLLKANEKKWIGIEYNSIKTAYGDVPRKLIRKILSRRSDLNFIRLSVLKGIIKDKDLKAEEYTGEPTIFSKVIIK